MWYEKTISTENIFIAQMGRKVKGIKMKERMIAELEEKIKTYSGNKKESAKRVVLELKKIMGQSKLSGICFPVDGRELEDISMKEIREIGDDAAIIGFHTYVDFEDGLDISFPLS